MDGLRHVIVVCGALLLTGTAHAFKIDTHLWLADHLLTEIAAGHVRFDDGTTIALEERIQQSIVRYPNAFRIGVLGADLYPDLIAGQMTTHPGLPPKLDADPDSVPTDVASLAALMGDPFTDAVHGWQTDDWLAFVRDEAMSWRPGPSPEIAFAFGYLLHAAMDTWAHSYVNLYTGDLFSIVENQEVAARHTAMEIFIKQMHPEYVQPLGDIAGRDAGRSTGGRLAQRTPVDNLSQHSAPIRFVRETLILNPQVANQYARTPGAQHVYAMWAVWDLAGRSRAQWQNVRQNLDVLLDESTQAVLDAEAAWNTADNAKRLAAETASAALTAKQGAEDAVAASGDALAGVIGNILAFLENTGISNATAATVESFLNFLPPPMRTGYYQAKAAAEQADTALSEAIDDYQEAAAAHNDAAAEAIEAFDELELRRGAKQAAQNARQTLWLAVNTGLEGWQRNIETAVDAYVRAFEETAREIMRDSGDRFRKGANVTWPLKEWAACWGPLFGMPALPLPPGMAAEACQQGLSAYSHARQNLTLLQNNVPFDLLGLGALKDNIVEYEEALHEQVRDGMPIAGQLIADGLGPLATGAPVEVVPGTASFMATLWDKEVSADDLNAEFAQDGSNSNLPVYPPGGPASVAGMMFADGLPASRVSAVSGMLDFEPVRNALVMSRLALLDGEGLNELVTHYGVTASAYPDGAPAYPQNAMSGTVLIGAIRSIDGNHQWQPVAPPLPRRVFGASNNLADQECSRFGYPADGNYAGTCEKDAAAEQWPPLSDWLDHKRGFRLWLDPVMRERVFERLFAGPLSVAVCSKLGNAATEHYAGLGCGNEPPYPPSVPSAQSVASFVGLQSRPVISGARRPAPDGRASRVAPGGRTGKTDAARPPTLQRDPRRRKPVSQPARPARSTTPSPARTVKPSAPSGSAPARKVRPSDPRAPAPVQKDEKAPPSVEPDARLKVDSSSRSPAERDDGVRSQFDRRPRKQ